MEKRIYLAILLSLVILYASRVLFPPKPATPVAEQANSNAKAPPAAQTPAQATPSPTPPPDVTRVAGTAVEDIQATEQQDIQVETELYTATLSNHGAVLKSLRLKDPYHHAKGKDNAQA